MKEPKRAVNLWRLDVMIHVLAAIVMVIVVVGNMHFMTVDYPSMGMLPVITTVKYDARAIWITYLIPCTMAAILFLRAVPALKKYRRIMWLVNVVLYGIVIVVIGISPGLAVIQPVLAGVPSLNEFGAGGILSLVVSAVLLSSSALQLALDR
nr:hypothetical protein [Candidatus Sigynarchaeum springense]